MAGQFLDPRRISVMPRHRVVVQAQRKQQAIADRATKLGRDAPPYEFLEYIGKGAYGLVFKCKNRNTQQICAVKILDTDQDYKNMQDYYNRDDSIASTVKEINALQQLRDLKAENINTIHEAFDFDNQVWIVSDYAAGGSLATLMKANNRQGISEDYIVPIVREVTIALRSIHRHNFIHRDLKCANILILESGHVQLCDFGVAGVLESNVSKRSTIVGTPFWMPPELMERLGQDDPNLRYGTEVDIWALGCTIHEMATGRPPFTSFRDPTLIGQHLRDNPPDLDDQNFSPKLRSFILRCLQTAPDQRPSANDLLSDPFLANTEEIYPVSKIAQVIEDYAFWKASGGQRHSLFNEYGAQPDEDPLLDVAEASDEWNFSVSEEFDRRLSVRFDQIAADPETGWKQLDDGRVLMPSMAQVVEEQRIKRGAGRLAGLFDTGRAAYDGEVSDLPLRHSFRTDRAGDRTTMIDLDDAMPDFDGGFSLDLDSVPTIKAKRITRTRDDDGFLDVPRRQTQDFQLSLDPPSDEPNPYRRTQDWTFPWVASDASDTTAKRISNRKTQDWKFPSAQDMYLAASSDPEPFSEDDFTIQRPPLLHAATMPTSLNHMRKPSDRLSMIDLDDAFGVEMPDTRPSTSGGDSAVSELAAGDPFDLDEQLKLSQSNNRTSTHIKSQSEPTAAIAPSADGTLAAPDDTTLAHNRSSSMTGGEAATNSQRDSRESQMSRSSGSTVVGGSDGKPKFRSRRPTELSSEPDPGIYTLNGIAAQDHAVPPAPHTGQSHANSLNPRKGLNELNEFVFNPISGFAGALDAGGALSSGSSLQFSSNRPRNAFGSNDSDWDSSAGGGGGGSTVNTLKPRFRSRTRGGTASSSKGSTSSAGSSSTAFYHYPKSSTSSAASYTAGSSAAAAAAATIKQPHLLNHHLQSGYHHPIYPPSSQTTQYYTPGAASHPLHPQHSKANELLSSSPHSVVSTSFGSQPYISTSFSNIPHHQISAILAPGASKDAMWTGMRPLLEGLPAKTEALKRMWRELVERNLGVGGGAGYGAGSIGVVHNGYGNGVGGGSNGGIAIGAGMAGGSGSGTKGSSVDDKDLKSPAEIAKTTDLGLVT